MNKRNELRAKLQACHNQQQQTRGGAMAGGPSAVNQISKAKRPAAVAAISAIVPKKPKVEHKFQHKHLHSLASHHNQGPSFSSSTSALSSLEQRQQQQQQQQSLLLVREAAECAASAVDNAAGDVVVEESGGGTVGPMASSSAGLRHRTSSTAAATTFGSSSPAATTQRGGGTAEDEQQQQQNQAVSAPIACASSVDSWLYSADGRQIDDAIAELSLDKAVHHLTTTGAIWTSSDHQFLQLSPEAFTRLITLVSQCVDLISDEQIRLLFPALRAHRLKGFDGAEKLLLLIIKRGKQRDGVDDGQTQRQKFPFTRPPPTKIETETELPTAANNNSVDDSNEQKTNGAKVKSEEEDDGKVELMETNGRKMSDQIPSSEADAFRQSLTEKNADELLELLLSNAKMDEQQQHLVVSELLDKQPDLLDVHGPNFDVQLNALFACRLPIARALIAHQLAHCASASVIKRSVTLLLNSFNSSFNPFLVLTFVAKICGTMAAEDTKVDIMLNGEQSFVLALYVLEDIEQHHMADMTETALNSLLSVRLFRSVLDNLVCRQLTGFSSSSSAVPSSFSSADLLETFTRHYRTHMDKLRSANLAANSFFNPSGNELGRRRHGLNMLYQMVCHYFPVVPSKCLFLGMFAAVSHGAVSAQTQQHITRAKFDQLITGTIGEIFELITKTDKGGPETELALDKARQLVQHFRNCRDVQFSRYMPLLSTKVQLLVDSLAGREVKNSPHCALLLLSLDLITATLRNILSGADDDDDSADRNNESANANGHRKTEEKDKNGTDSFFNSPPPPLIQTATIALQSMLRLLQKNRRNRQIQPLCEKLCNAVVQLLKCVSSCSINGTVSSADLKQRQRRPNDGTNIVRRLLRSYGVLLGELSDWKALNVPDRAVLKRTVTNIAATQ